MLLDLLATTIGSIFAIRFLLHAPDPDRHLAYPGQPERWHGATGTRAFRWSLVARSGLFWSTALALGGLGGLLVGLTTRLANQDWAASPARAVAAYGFGLAVATVVAGVRLRNGPGMMSSLPRLDRRDTGPGQKPRVLFICGSLNQTTQMHAIANELREVEAFFTPYYSTHWLFYGMVKLGLQEYAISGYKRRAVCLKYLSDHQLPVDLHAEHNHYDLVLSCNDQIVPPNLENVPMVLVQEGIMELDNWVTWVWRHFPFVPRVLAGTSTTGMSKRFERFCVASKGYRDHFAARGIHRSRLVVTGMPNFDRFDELQNRHSTDQGYTLVCTSDARETWQRTNRQAFIRKAIELAASRPLVFKLHPNENVKRATREILALAPQAQVVTEGRAEEWVANCDILITEWSSVTFCGLALGKEVHSNFPADQVRALAPVQNGCAATLIANVCRDVLKLQPHRASSMDAEFEPARATA